MKLNTKTFTIKKINNNEKKIKKKKPATFYQYMYFK